MARPLGKIYENEVVVAKYGRKVQICGHTLFNPTRQTYLDMGFEELPTCNPPEGWHDEWRIAYDGEGNPYIEAYAVEDPVVPPAPEPPKIYSKLRLIEGCKSREIWPQVKSIIEGLDKMDEFIAAQELSSDYPGFDDMVAYFRSQLPGVDIDAILAEAEK